MSKPPLTPANLQAFIAEHQLQADLLELPVPTPTVDAAAAALGVPPTQILKSLLFWVSDQPLMVLASGPTIVDRRAIAAYCKVGRKQVKLMSPADVLEVSGYPVGGVPPFGSRQQVTTLMDEQLLLHTIVYAGGGAENTLMKVAPQDILRVTGATRLDLQVGQADNESGTTG